MKLLGMMFAIMYTTHVLCCLWYVVGFSEMVNVKGELIPDNVGWIEREGFVVINRASSCQNVARVVKTAVKVCASASGTEEDIGFCAGVALTGDGTARQLACELEQVGGGSRCSWVLPADEDSCHAAGLFWITDLEREYDEVHMVSMWTQYLTSFYWSITTLTTVGYGDISAVTNRFLYINDDSSLENQDSSTEK